MITIIASTIAANAPSMVNTVPTVDFSIIDTIVGVVITLSVMLVVGFFLFKYKLVVLGGQSDDVPHDNGHANAIEKRESGLQEDREARRADRMEMKAELKDALLLITDSINQLREDIKMYSKEHQECQRQLPEKYVQWEILNKILDRLDIDRKERWKKFDEHKHDQSSGVVVTK